METRFPAPDVTFISPIQYDHSDRIHNLRTTVAFLMKYFDTNFIIGENWPTGVHGTKPGPYPIQYSAHENFHRTKMLNDMTRAAATDIVFNWDADVIVPAPQVIEAIERLRAGVDVCYPFDGTHECVDRVDAARFWDSLDIADLAVKRHRNWNNPTKSVGGCLGYRVSSYWRVGGENENFISYGPEDSERWHRYRVLGLNVARVGGSLYHIEHWKGNDSSTSNPFFAANQREFERIKRLSKEQLQNEIKTWEWAKQVS